MRLAVLLAASLACVGIGFAKSAALSAHVKDLETLQKIIQYLRGEIVTAASPLPDAFWETGRRMRDPYRDFLQDISEDMRRPDGKTLPAILEENTAVHLADTRLTKEEKEEPDDSSTKSETLTETKISPKKKEKSSKKGKTSTDETSKKTSKSDAI